MYNNIKEKLLICIYYSETFKFCLIVILEKTIRIPRSISVKASKVLRAFLNKTPAERLGCNGFFEIVQHEFFKSIDWDLVSYLYHTLMFISFLTF